MTENPKIFADRYEVRGHLGQGGAASVYRVWDQELHVERALKVLDTESRQGEGVQRARFAREARLMAKLHSHPHILTVFDVNMGSPPFIVSNLCPAGGMHERLQRGALPPTEAIDVVLQITAALETLHGLGIIHRDVKPSNILTGPDGKAKLCDFGIAKVEDATRYTSECAIMGSAAFMAPEQRIDSASVTPKADQYALGATLHALLTGETPIDLFAAKADSPRWWAVPPAVATVVRKACAYADDDRFPTITAFANALRTAEEAITHPTSQHQGPRIQPLASAPPEIVSWYLSTMPERIEQVRNALRALDTSIPDTEAALRRVGHMLRGSGRSFGFPTVSTAAGALEDAERLDLANRASELIYVLRHIASSDEPADASIVVVCQDRDLASRVALLFPHATIHSDGAFQPRHADHADLLMTQGVDSEALSNLRHARPRLPFIVLEDGPPEPWRAAGADRVLPRHPDPEQLVSTTTLLLRPSAAVTAFLPMPEFTKQLAELRASGTGPAHHLIVVEGDGEPRALIDRRNYVGWPVIFGLDPERLFISVPSTESAKFLDSLAASSKRYTRMVTLPVDDSRTVTEMLATATAALPSAAPGQVTTLRANTTPRRVFVAEDDPDVARLVRDVLVAQGHEVRFFGNGAQALLGVAAEPPDLLVLDVDLPEMDGLSVLQALKLRRKTAQIPILMLTGRNKDEDVVLSLEMGATDHIGKPFDVRVLAARLRSLLTR